MDILCQPTYNTYFDTATNRYCVRNNSNNHPLVFVNIWLFCLI